MCKYFMRFNRPKKSKFYLETVLKNQIKIRRADWNLIDRGFNPKCRLMSSMQRENPIPRFQLAPTK